MEVFDGFGPHTSSYYAMKHRYHNKILCLNEEGDSSHENQAYDKFVAKSDKSMHGITSGSDRFTRLIGLMWVSLLSKVPNLRLGQPPFDYPRYQT
jgi:hypothetical protein